MNKLKGVFVTEDVTLITFENAPANINFISGIFRAIADAEINVDMISQTPPRGDEASISCTVQDEDFYKLLETSNKFRKANPELKISVSNGNCKISVCGEFMRDQFGVAATVFDAAASVGTDIRIITTSETAIGMLVEKSSVDATVKAIEKAFA